MEELVALMKYMVGHNAAHAKELADLAEVVQAALDGLDNVADFVPEEADSAEEVRHAQ